MLHLLRTRRFAPLFWTQLLGAFNDNLFKSALVMTLTFGSLRSSNLDIDALVNATTVLLVLPFFLFSATAGQLADRIDKARLVKLLKLSELLVMMLALGGFVRGSLAMLFGALFLMGTQSAFFGPVKYAILPQHLDETELVGGNALVEAGTFIAILTGTILGAVLVALPAGTWIVGAVLVLVSLAGVITGRQVPSAPPRSQVELDLHLPRATLSTLRIARRDRPIWLAILGVSWFWAVGAFALGQMPRLATNVGGDEGALTWMLAAFSVGIGVGSVACDKLSGGRVEVGLVPPAGLAMAGALLAVSQARTVGSVCASLASLGVFGGLFIVPLYALMQARARDHERSRVIAANNIVGALFMVVAALYATVRLAMGATIGRLVVEVAALHLVVVVAALFLLHREVLRVCIGLLVRWMYRIDARGLQDHLPKEGPALLVANHLSFVDAFVLGGLCRRPVRFVMDHRMTRLRGLRWFFRLARVIPIASRKEDPALLDHAFAEIDAALAAGEIVGIFPEGKCTRDGTTDVFRPGVEKILKRRPAPVVPIALDGLWGSFFSYARGYPMTSWPRRFRAKVRVVAGAPLPPTVSAAELRQAVERLRQARMERKTCATFETNCDLPATSTYP